MDLFNVSEILFETIMTQIGTSKTKHKARHTPIREIIKANLEKREKTGPGNELGVIVK